MVGALEELRLGHLGKALSFLGKVILGGGWNSRRGKAETPEAPESEPNAIFSRMPACCLAFLGSLVGSPSSPRDVVREKKRGGNATVGQTPLLEKAGRISWRSSE